MNFCAKNQIQSRCLDSTVFLTPCGAVSLHFVRLNPRIGVLRYYGAGAGIVGLKVSDQTDAGSKVLFRQFL
jgi:hypothetical protein